MRLGQEQHSGYNAEPEFSAALSQACRVTVQVHRYIDIVRSVYKYLVQLPISQRDNVMTSATKRLTSHVQQQATQTQTRTMHCICSSVNVCNQGLYPRLGVTDAQETCTINLHWSTCTRNDRQSRFWSVCQCIRVSTTSKVNSIA